MAGFFVVLEGPDGVGKTTQARLLAEWLRETGREVVECREPGGTPLGEAVRAILKGDLSVHVREVKPARFRAPEEHTFPIEINPRAELLLFSAARAQLVDDVIRPALERGAVVVCDRFTMSSYVYQGGLGKCRGDDVRHAIEIATHGLKPDLVILLLVRPSALAERRPEPGDRIESAMAGREELVLRAYVTEAAWAVAEDDQTVARIITDDPIPVVRDRIRAVVSEALGLPGTGHAGPG